MTIHVAGLVRLKDSDKYPEMELQAHFKKAVPTDPEGNSLKVYYFFNCMIIKGSLSWGPGGMKYLEAWFSNRLTTLEISEIQQAVLSVELENPHRFYTWVRGQDPGIKAVAMEA